MLHLAIANMLLNKPNRIEKAADFYLGSIAPDFIHVRENYNSEMKKLSHLCVGEQAWAGLPITKPGQKMYCLFSMRI
jgi:hypothetical protein